MVKALVWSLGEISSLIFESYAEKIFWLYRFTGEKTTKEKSITKENEISKEHLERNWNPKEENLER